MPLFVHCNVCKRVMGETDLNRLKKFKKVHGERCEECTRIFEHIDKFVDERKKVKVRELDDIFTGLKNDVKHEIRRVVESPPPKKGVFTRIKHYLFGEPVKEEDGQETEGSL